MKYWDLIVIFLAGTVVAAFLLLAIGIIPIMTATLIPSWATGIIDPDEAIRR